MRLFLSWLAMIPGTIHFEYNRVQWDCGHFTACWSWLRYFTADFASLFEILFWVCWRWWKAGNNSEYNQVQGGWERVTRFWGSESTWGNFRLLWEVDLQLCFESAVDKNAVLVVLKNIQKCCYVEHVTGVFRLRSTRGKFTPASQAHLQFCFELVGGDELLVPVNTTEYVVVRDM